MKTCFKYKPFLTLEWRRRHHRRIDRPRSQPWRLYRWLSYAILPIFAWWTWKPVSFKFDHFCNPKCLFWRRRPRRRRRWVTGICGGFYRQAILSIQHKPAWLSNKIPFFVCFISTFKVPPLYIYRFGEFCLRIYFC